MNYHYTGGALLNCMCKSKFFGLPQVDLNHLSQLPSEIRYNAGGYIRLKES